MKDSIGTEIQLAQVRKEQKFGDHEAETKTISHFRLNY
jgi:hypothetical protein